MDIDLWKLALYIASMIFLIVKYFAVIEETAYPVLIHTSLKQCELLQYSVTQLLV